MEKAETEEIQQPAAEEAAEEAAKETSVEELAQLREKAALAGEYYNRLARAQADFENARKRFKADADEAKKYAAQRLVLELLPVVDNLERAVAAGDGSDPDAWRQGVELVVKQFLGVLEKEGIKQIAAAGQAFDPNLHEAVMQEETGEVVEGTIVQEFQKGYQMHDRVIRPSLVKVAKRPG